MPRTKPVEQYLKVKYKFGVKITSWALKHCPGIVSCRYCFTTVDFAKVKGQLITHGESDKHRQGS